MGQSHDAVAIGLAHMDHQPLWEWAHDNVVLPPSYARPGRFSVDDIEFVKEPMRALLDPTVREVVCMSGVQCLKTLIGELWVLHTIVENPGPMQWLQPTDPEAKAHTEERFDDLIATCRQAHDLYSPERYKVKAAFRKFVHGMYIRIEGADNIKNLQRKSIKNQFCSEVWNWPQGRLSEAEARTTQFSANRKRYIESQPGYADDDIHLRYKYGSQEVLHFRCQGCGHSQPLVWSTFRDDKSRAGIVWDDNETTRTKDGRWIENAVKDTIRFECIKCGHRHYDEPRTRRLMMQSCHYVARNPDAPKWIRTFTWNQLIVITIPWFDLWLKWQRAMEADAQGKEELKIQFIQKSLADPYDPSSLYVHTKPKTYDKSEKWSDEKYRFMTVDVQDQEVFWFVVRGWSLSGESRLWDCGELLGWQEVKDKQIEWKLDGKNVGIDSGYDTRNVYLQCVLNEWKAMKGDDGRDYFTYRNPKTRQNVNLPYKFPFAQGDPTIGVATARNLARLRKVAGRRTCPLIVWCNKPIKDVLFRLRDGRGASWLAPDNVTDDWTQQMRSERRTRYYDSRTGYERVKYERIGKRPNHLLDCEAMQVVLATTAHILGE